MSVESALIEEPKLRYAWLWWAIGWALVALTVFDSLRQHPPPMLSFFYSDKLLHFSGYFALGTWFGGVTRRTRYPLVAVALIGLGGLIEIVQGLMHNGRDADWLDFVANVLGVSLALAVAYAGLGGWLVWLERLLRLRK